MSPDKVAIACSLINKLSPLGTKISAGDFLSPRALSGSNPISYSPYTNPLFYEGICVWRMRRDLNPRYGSPRINDFESLAFSLSATHP